MNRIFLIFVILVLSATSLTAQEEQQAASGTKYVFTLEDVVQLAKEQSLNAIRARHSFRASYFNYMSYKATFLPKLTLRTNPLDYDHSYAAVEGIDAQGNYTITESKKNVLSSTANLDLSQNIGFTGGVVSLGSDFSRRQNLDDGSDNATQYNTTPIRLSVNQPLNGYNSLRWQKKIEPLIYEEARQNYVMQMEQIAQIAADYFFALARAQVTLKMREMNYSNSKTLYEISQGRYLIGTIAEDALLKMELTYMQAESDLNTARINIVADQNRLRSFLGFKDDVEIQLQEESHVPDLKVSYDKALELALSRNPNIILYNRQILEKERDAAFAKSEKGITLSLNGSFGLDKKASTLKDAYSPNFDDRENVRAGVTIPILDWNQARNRYRNAQSQLEVTQTQMEQNKVDFQQNVYLQVMQFNMQENQVRIATKADTIAQKGYDVSYQRYMIGKVSVTDLNIASTDKDNARTRYIETLGAYWRLYYEVRRLTLFDFQNNKPLEEDFEKIIGE
jgi:outer membrane protein TolC